MGRVWGDAFGHSAELWSDAAVLRCTMHSTDWTSTVAHVHSCAQAARQEVGRAVPLVPSDAAEGQIPHVHRRGESFDKERSRAPTLG